MLRGPRSPWSDLVLELRDLGFKQVHCPKYHGLAHLLKLLESGLKLYDGFNQSALVDYLAIQNLRRARSSVLYHPLAFCYPTGWHHHLLSAEYRCLLPAQLAFGPAGLEVVGVDSLARLEVASSFEEGTMSPEPLCPEWRFRLS